MSAFQSTHIEGVLFECTYEYQRWFPIKKWSDKLLPTDRPKWSTEDGKQERTKESVEAPVQHQWTSEWLVDKGKMTDKDGWMYAIDMTAQFHEDMKSTDCVRRRRWIRAYEAVGPVNRIRSAPQKPLPFTDIKFVALYAFQGSREDEVSFPEGAVITITDVSDPDWYVGSYDNTTGVFPSNYLELAGEEITSKPSIVSALKGLGGSAMSGAAGISGAIQRKTTRRPAPPPASGCAPAAGRGLAAAAPTPLPEPVFPAVFRMELKQVMSRYSTPRSVPIAFDRLATFLQERALQEEGLFRIPGNAAHVQQLKQRLDEDEEYVFAAHSDYQQVECVAAVLKLFLREMPVPLFTFDLYAEFNSASHQVGEAKISTIAALVRRLPAEYRCLLERLVELLCAVSANQGVNKMSATNLAVCIGPNVHRPESDGGGFMLINSSGAALLECMIENRDAIFLNRAELI